MTTGIDGRWRQRLEHHTSGREAVCFEGRSFSFFELARRVGFATQELEGQSVEPGDLVGLLASPSLAGVVWIHALFDRETVMVPLNLRWTEAEIVRAIEAASLRWLVVENETETMGRTVSMRTGCGLLRFEETEGGGLERLRSPAEANDVELLTRRESLCRQGAALVLFTSGTSGSPKGALLSRGNLIASAAGSIALLGSEADDRWLCCMPLFHIGGLSILIRSAVAGTSVVLHRRFDPDAVSASLDQDRISCVSLVATMLARLLEVRAGRVAPDGLRTVLLGGGPASQELLSRARSLGFPLAPTYGLTEAASQVATRPPTDEIESEADLAAGLVPIPGTELRVVDSAHVVVDAGIVGEIEVRGSTLMLGYFDDLEATARVFRRGWFATGDLGRLDSAGRLRVLDRRSDLIVSGGENVYPAEVESVLLEHPDVAEAGVVGVSDEVFGERPRAYLVARSGHSIETSAVLDFCSGRLARYKLPKDWIVLDQLPRTASGKLLRRDLKARVD